MSEDAVFTINLSGKQTLLIIGVILGGPAYFSQSDSKEDLGCHNKHCVTLANDMVKMKKEMIVMNDSMTGYIAEIEK